MKRLQANGLEIIISSPAKSFRNAHTFSPDTIVAEDVHSPRPFPYEWTILVQWTLKDGHTYDYFYGPGLEFHVAVNREEILKRLHGPAPTGGYLYNLGVRPQLLLKQA